MYESRAISINSSNGSIVCPVFTAPTVLGSRADHVNSEYSEPAPVNPSDAVASAFDCVTGTFSDTAPVAGPSVAKNAPS